MTDAYIFGEIIKNFEPCPQNINDLLRRARNKRNKIAAAPIDDIINILDAVSRAWADKNYCLRKIAFDYLKEQTGYSDAMLESGFETISFICSRAFLLSRLKNELNCEHAFEKLDLISCDAKSGGMIKINPLGNILHVSASNVFISAVDSLVSGFITKNVNFLKLSRGDLLFPILFAKSILELDKNSLIADSFSVFYYKGGDNDIEKILGDNMDAIVVWGGAEAVCAWRRNAAFSARLIEYGPKISFSLIDSNTIKTQAALETLCDSLAQDISIWEQAACSSPQNIYLLPANGIDTEKFAHSLFLALKRKEIKLPPKELSLDEQIEILKFREKYFSSFISGEGGRIYYNSDSMPASVAISALKDCEPSVLMRNIIIKSIESFDEFYNAISKLSFYLQAVSIAVDDKQILSVTDKLHSLGVSRVLIPGKHGEPFNGAPHDAKYLLNDLVRYSALEIEGDAQTNLLLADITDSRRISLLKNILKDAYHNTAYYKRVIPPEIFEIEGDAFYDSFTRLVPMLGKNEIYDNCLPDSTDIIAGGDAGLGGAYVFASGGSTGGAKFSLYSNDELEYVTGVLADIYRAAKITPRRRVANLFIAGGLWTSFIVANMALEKIGVTNLAMGGNTDFATILKFFQKLRPDTIVGLPSIILKFAEYCRKESADVNIDLILYGGEHMRPPARQYLKEVFGVKDILSAGYAAVDCGPAGFQCAHLSGAYHHVLSGYQHVEFIKSDGTPAQTGQAGEIVVTNLNRCRMPVIRFKTGDMGVALDYKCECGRSNKVFELLGRCDDILVVGGANLTPRDFEDAIAAFAELSSIFQLVACTKNGFDSLELFTELKEGLTFGAQKIDEIKARLIDELKCRSFKIKTMLESDWISSFELFIRPAGQIERIGRTGKVINIKDMRG